MPYKDRDKQGRYMRTYVRTDQAARAFRARQKAGIPEPARECPANCECCGQVPAGTGVFKGLVIDHCHVTGKFRGWLCGGCNLGIGQLGDQLPRLRLAVAYLERNS